MNASNLSCQKTFSFFTTYFYDIISIVATAIAMAMAVALVMVMALVI